jgi:hypothetical protein
MAYSQGRPLGIAPAVAAIIIQQAPKILADIEGAFTGSSYDATHQRILQWVQMILADPTGAVSGNYIPGNNFLANAANAMLGLRCWAGDQSILTIYRQISGDPAPAGCGCEVDHGCRADAQAALARVDQALNQAVPIVSSAPQPIPVPSNSGTLPVTIPGGITVGLPVPGSTVATAQVYGVPVWAWLAGGVGLAFLLGKRR